MKIALGGLAALAVFVLLVVVLRPILNATLGAIADTLPGEFAQDVRDAIEIGNIALAALAAVFTYRRINIKKA